MSFTVCRASAGSGKTYLLVKEYLKLILDKPYSFRNTLAVTFTNKAAAEMKSRILEALKNIAQKADNNATDNATEELLQVISSEINVPEDVMVNNAEQALKLILHNYSDFAVSTIDSFVTNIVRSFAKDLMLPVNFDIELDMDVLISQAIDLLISRVGNNAELTHLLVQFVESKADAEKGFNIELELHDISRYLFKENSMAQLEKLKNLSMTDFRHLAHKLQEMIRKHEAALTSIAQKACGIIENRKIAPQAFYYKERGLYGYFKKIQGADFSGIDNKNVAKGIDQDKWTSGAASKEDIAAIDSIKDELLRLYLEIGRYAESHLKQYELYRLIYRNIYPLSVMTQIYHLVEDIKAENNILHISEFNKKIAAIVLNEPVPFIYERIGNRFRNYMVDEFQDTSVMQWHNLLPLFENALAESGYTMIVGDGKQAIYRWRDGDVEQFIKLPEVYAGRKTSFHYQKEAVLKKHFKAQTLNKNYRSLQEIVDFNNRFFDFAKTYLNSLFSSIYNDVAQTYSNSKPGGYVSIKFLDKEDYYDNTLAELKTYIDNLIQNKAFSASDIAVLCRTNKNAAKIAHFLMENNIEVVSNESLLLKNAPVVNFLIALLRYIQSPDNTISKVHILNYLEKQQQLSFKDIHLVFRQTATQEGFFEKLIEENFPGFSIKSLQKLSVYELCETLIRIFHLYRSPGSYLQFFLDAVLLFHKKNQNAVKSFLKWWDDKADKLSVVVPEGLNAVQVLTIHKAKGLQFPVVIFPFAKEAQLKPTQKDLWLNIKDPGLPELETFLVPVTPALEKTNHAEVYQNEMQKTHLDLLNMVYVAFTRAEEQFYIITEKPGANAQSVNIHNMLKGFLISSGLWHDAESHYTFGHMQEKRKTAKQQSENKMYMDTFLSNPWSDKLVLKYQAADKFDVGQPDKNFRYGNLIHTAMSLIETADDIDKAVESLFIKGIVDADEVPSVKNKMLGIVQHPDLKDFYTSGNKFRNEGEIMDAEGHIFRPDRIVFTKKTTAVIDYKTGKAHEAHKKQILKYAQILSECGYRNITCYLVYVDYDKVDVVSN